MPDSPKDPSAASPPLTDVAEVAKIAFTLIVAGDAHGLVARFAPRMREAFSLEKTTEVILGLVAARGPWKSLERTEGETSQVRGTWLVKAAPVGPSDGMQMLTHYTRVNGGLVEKAIAPVRFIPARGLARKEAVPS